MDDFSPKYIQGVPDDDQGITPLEEQRATRTTAPRAHRHTLIEMNRSAFTARRDIAHERVVQILREEIPSADIDLRMKLYELCVRLVDEAVFATERSQLNNDVPVLHYLRLLRTTMSTSLAIVQHEKALKTEQKEFPDLSQPGAVAMRTTGPHGMSSNESNLLSCVAEVLDFGHPVLQNDTEERLKKLSEEEQERYQKAREEYHKYYHQLHPSETDENDA